MSNSKQRRAAGRQPQSAGVRDGLQNVAAGLGTNRDKMSYSGYTTPLMLDRTTLGNMYRSSWLAKKIVNIPAEDMTRAWRQVMFDDETQEDSQFAVEELERKLCIRPKVTNALKWGRLYGGSALILGVGDPKNYDKPLDPASVKKGELKFVQVLDRWMCVPGGVLNWDLSSSNFGLPDYYTIATQNGPRIHHSRVIRFIGQQLPLQESMQQAGWGDSDLQAAYDTLLGRDTITAAIATMMFEANVDVIKAQGLGDLLSTKEGSDQVTKRFQLSAMMKSFNRLLLLDENETYDKRSNSFSGLDAIMREFRSEAAGACDIPVSRLFGLSAGGLNATGDNEVRNYYDMVAAKQEHELRHALERLDEVMVRSALGAMPDDYRFTFNKLWQMDETESATVKKTQAETDKIYFDMGVLNEGSIARELKERGTYTTMTEDDVELAEELADKPPEPPAGYGPDGQPLPKSETSPEPEVGTNGHQASDDDGGEETEEEDTAV